ncbi:unnamed protein product [Effrenium voratum]|uniref:Uncharacterized protein n=1 Tax=Effrenium voratum TaxID=2562239 RepID=A0AA36IWF8_9DINO|nr:unnamed protein product [Effrenium voratum]CAJ1394141.1 unnamed protein product [Effrenium voratum]CAJ1457561.1 unnamed protein product [Effrenium voratum]
MQAKAVAGLCAFLAAPAHGVLLTRRPELSDVAPLSPLGAKSDGFLQPHVELINKTSVQVEALDECMCVFGTFWHQEMQKCVPQRARGGNCGAFAAEMWPAVCQDGLACKIPVEFDSDGQSDDPAVLKQAVCVDCDPNDHCQWGAVLGSSCV